DRIAGLGAVERDDEDAVAALGEDGRLVGHAPAQAIGKNRGAAGVWKGMTPRTLILPAMSAVAALALAACGGSSGSSSSSSSSSSPPLVVKSASKEKVGAVLVSSRGLTLYRNTAEKGGKIACTGSCA